MQAEIEARIIAGNKCMFFYDCPKVEAYFLERSGTFLNSIIQMEAKDGKKSKVLRMKSLKENYGPTRNEITQKGPEKKE